MYKYFEHYNVNRVKRLQSADNKYKYSFHTSIKKYEREKWFKLLCTGFSCLSATLIDFSSSINFQVQVFKLVQSWTNDSEKPTVIWHNFKLNTIKFNHFFLFFVWFFIFIKKLFLYYNFTFFLLSLISSGFIQLLSLFSIN